MNWQQEQEQFWQWITRPQDLREDSPAIEALFAPHSRVPQAEALGIYNNAYHQRLIGIARDMYPLLYQTLGDDAFTALWLDYLAAHPPRPGPMGQLANELHDFLSAHEHYGQLPGLLDIVQLESLFIELFDCRDEAAYTLSQLQQLPHEDWAEHCWVAKADWALMSSQFDLERYWQSMRKHFRDDGAAAGSAPVGLEKLDEPSQFLIHRRNHTMHFQRLAPSMAGFLHGIQEGRDFAALCEQIASHHPAEKVPELSLALLLRSIEMELLRA